MHARGAVGAQDFGPAMEELRREADASAAAEAAEAARMAGLAAREGGREKPSGMRSGEAVDSGL